MKDIRGRITRKLKSISTITSLKQTLLFQENPPNKQSLTSPSSVKCEKESNPPYHITSHNTTLPEIIKEDQEKQHENDQQVYTKREEAEEVEESSKLQDFDKNCPPGGSESVVFYTTSLRGIRKTFEDCNRIRFLLESFRVLYDERDVSMHMDYREELWKIMGGGRVVPPRLFIKGRYIGGADEVVGLHEQGNLGKIFKGIPTSQSKSPCSGCGGVRFVLCIKCNGSRKVSAEGAGGVETVIRCLECNENGLVKCPTCSLS